MLLLHIATTAVLPVWHGLVALQTVAPPLYQGGKQLGMARARVSVFANDYMGVLRRKVACQMATPASQVRLLFSGEPKPSVPNT